MSINAPSFRLPFTLPDDIHPEVKKALQFLFNGVTNHEQAFGQLQPQIAALKSQLATTTEQASATAATVSGASAVATPGGVNDQTGATAYTTQSADYGSLVVVNNGGTPVPVTLNSGVANNFYTRITNQGSTNATLAPDSTYSGAQINGGASYSLAAGASVNVFFDGATKNWFAY